MFELIVAPSSAHNPRNSEASLSALREGELLLAYSDFFRGKGGDHDSARISAKRSSDGGRSWTERFTLQDNIGSMNVMSPSLLRLQSGEIAFAYARKNSTKDLRPFIRWSSDEGESWSESVPVAREDGYSEMDNDRLIQMRSGRLIAPVSWSPDVGIGHYVSHCYTSDDEGRSWKRSRSSVDVPGVGADEPAVVELRDESLLMVFRTSLGHIWAARSEDGGERWGAAYPLEALVSPTAPVNLKRIPGTGDLLVVWNHSPTKRTPLSAAVSSDEGETWGHPRNLETDPDASFAYPSMLFLDDLVYLSYYYADGKTIRLKLKVVPVAWFYRGEEVSPLW